MEIKKIFVIGAGQMGSGIVQAALQAGYEVTMRDINDAILDRAKGKIEKSLDKQVYGTGTADTAQKACTL